MKKTWWYGGGLILTLAVVMGLAGVSHSAHEAKTVKADAGETPSAASSAQPEAPQERLSSQELRAIELNVERAQPVALAAAIQDHTGELNEKNLQVQIEAVLEEIIRQKVDFTWGSFRPNPIVILYEDPTGKDRTRMGIGIAVPPNTKVSAPLRLEHFRNPAVRHVHKGPHRELAAVYRSVGEAMRRTPPRAAALRQRREGFPVVLQILDDPTRVRAEDLRTVINIPLK